MNEFYLNIIKAISAILFVVLLDIIFEVFLKQKIKDKTKSIKSRVRLRYVLGFCLAFFLANIWVEGFEYLLTIIGVIAAALTITQKEYLMNVFGWLIIMWRDLFVEGEYIEIGKYTGFVKNIGPLYFTLEESSEIDSADRTGKIVKIPNSLVANHPITRYSWERIFVEGKVIVTFDYRSSLSQLKRLSEVFQHEIESLLRSKYENGTPKEQTDLKRLQNDESLRLKCLLKFSQDKPIGIQMRVRYYAYKKDLRLCEDKIIETIMHFVAESNDLKLSEVI